MVFNMVRAKIGYADPNPTVTKHNQSRKPDENWKRFPVLPNSNTSPLTTVPLGLLSFYLFLPQRLCQSIHM